MASTCTEWDWWKASPESPNSKPLKLFRKLPARAQGALFRMMQRWISGDLRPDGGDCKSLGNGVYYFRYRDGNNQYRVYFKMVGTTALGLHAIYKNKQRIPQEVMDVVMERASSGTART
ncbi:type II toxin-antitoxin system RelE/ParE family toxin [Tessaracoccus flavescens]|uniref:Addiction module toxin RelE n=1 Tax=Tessaracoccus flavescens TaxID=399497 RepID=A0A1Q2CXZ7_9ACTN|nr:type II toxin-antitoxin system RelE/ParE family toxin [Tessaracoccus flavescens]AQP50980.1 hypothetical protein BW733_09225 [Tessaracoccus flavescens]